MQWEVQLTIPYFQLLMKLDPRTALERFSRTCELVPVYTASFRSAGDRIQISLNNQILDAVIRAIVEQTDGLRLLVDFGH